MIKYCGPNFIKCRLLRLSRGYGFSAPPPLAPGADPPRKSRLPSAAYVRFAPTARFAPSLAWYRNGLPDLRFLAQLPARRHARDRHLRRAEPEQPDLRVYRILWHPDSPVFPEGRWSMSTRFPEGPVFHRASLARCMVLFELQRR